MNTFWNQQAVDGLFQNLAAGSFRPAGPREVALLLGLVVVVLVALAWSSWLVRTRIAARRRATSARLKGVATARHRLLPSDAPLVEALAGTLADPESLGHRVLLNEPTFRASRRLLLDRRPHTGFALTAFSTRLAFPPRRPGLLLENSAEIPIGTVLLSAGGDFRLVVSRIDESGVWSVAAEGHAPPSGRALVLTLHRPEGLYLFRSAVKFVEHGTCLLQHAAVLERQQRRRHFRHELRIPMQIDRAATHTLDVSAGGLRARALGNEPSADQVVALSFPSLPELPRSLRGTIVSADGGGVRIAFLPGQTGACDAFLRHCLAALREQDREERDAALRAPSAEADGARANLGPAERLPANR